MKLIYHKTDSFEEYSIFDVELVTLAYQQNLCLISPYIGINYLERLIQLSKSWRLITDFEEWIISAPSKDQRNKIVEFITKNSDKIKHISDIHAKVLISEHSAFLGAAKVELDRTNYSGYRRAHNPLYYRLVMDLEYRKKILDLCD
ncbi:hypothetical protein ACI760_09930 [Capnocytophaga canimorsus]|uniref:hypothetical protein n=1 Tax=Capnocytophaga canimorsus TaxID=28188 RepID=UPI00385BF9B5